MDEQSLTENEDTLPKILLRNYLRFGSSEIAMREKNKGIWQKYTWADYYNVVKYLTLAFLSMGLKPGERVAILGENKPQQYWFELAAHSAKATVVGIFADCTPAEVRYYVDHSESRFVICQDQEQVDKLLEIKNTVPNVQKVIYWDPKGLWNYADPLLMSFDQMVDMGKAYEKDHPNLFEESVASTKADDMCLFLYSSGTTGGPKAAMVSQKALIAQAEVQNSMDHYHENEEYLSFLPVAWNAEQTLGIACSLVYRLRANFPEEPETVQDNIREIGPQVVFFGSRLWENLIRMVQVKIQDSGWVNRLFYNAALRIGYIMSDYRMTGRRTGLFVSLAYSLADLSVFMPLRDNLGLRKTRVCYTSGGAVSPDILRYFHAIGINLKQLYGSSEVGMVTCHLDNQIKPETCGPALSGVDIKICDDGEIAVRSPKTTMLGYFKNEQETAERLRDGWFYTGDFGHLDDDGHLIVMDRMDDLQNLAGRQKFSPQYCEVRLRFSPYIKDALVMGRENEALIGALINIDLDNVGQWSETKHISYTTFADLSQKPEVIELIRQEIIKVNKVLPEYTRIKKFINLHKEFDPDEAEMTRTRKLRRTFLKKRYEQMIDAIFGSEEKIEVTSQIAYQDGRTGVTTSTIRVNQV
jgi:long-chain acyl-CoA synthetase